MEPQAELYAAKQADASGGLSEARLSPTREGQISQMESIVDRVEAAFKDLEPGQPIMLEGHRYYLQRRHGDSCAWATTRNTYDYFLTQGTLDRFSTQVRIHYVHHHPQNYDTTRFLSYQNGRTLLNSTDQRLINRLVQLFDNYLDGPARPLPL